jgi:hypothetical protein
MTPDEARKAVVNAHRVLRQDYFDDVRGVAEDLKERLAEGEFSDRDDFTQAIDEAVDGHGRIVYTGQALECLRYSENDGAYADEFGEDGIVEGGSIMWSRLAYSAFRANIIERLESLGIDVNDPIPEEEDEDEPDGPVITKGEGE